MNTTTTNAPAASKLFILFTQVTFQRTWEDPESDPTEVAEELREELQWRIEERTDQPKGKRDALLRELATLPFNPRMHYELWRIELNRVAGDETILFKDLARLRTGMEHAQACLPKEAIAS